MRITLSILILLYALTLQARATSFGFDRLTIEDGLSGNSINDIVQDPNGYLWFATKDGLNRYDGYEFKVFRHTPNDPESIDVTKRADVCQYFPCIQNPADLNIESVNRLSGESNQRSVQ